METQAPVEADGGLRGRSRDIDPIGAEVADNTDESPHDCGGDPLPPVGRAANLGSDQAHTDELARVESANHRRIRREVASTELDLSGNGVFAVTLLGEVGDVPLDWYLGESSAAGLEADTDGLRPLDFAEPGELISSHPS